MTPCHTTPTHRVATRRAFRHVRRMRRHVGAYVALAASVACGGGAAVVWRFIPPTVALAPHVAPVIPVAEPSALAVFAVAVFAVLILKRQKVAQ